MSGGSFNYLYLKDAGEMAGDIEQLERMIEALSDLGYADDVAQGAKELLDAYGLIEAKKEKLNDVFWAMEWWRSGDQGEDTVRKFIAKYRENKTPPTAEPGAESEVR
jgi:hypothetical protein